MRAGADTILLLKTNTDAQITKLIRRVNRLETELGKLKNAMEIVSNVEQAQRHLNAMAILSGNVQAVASLVASARYDCVASCTKAKKTAKF